SAITNERIDGTPAGGFRWRRMMQAINVPFPESEPKPPPMPPPPFPGQKPVREPDPSRLPDEAPLPNPDENNEPPQHADMNRTRRSLSHACLLAVFVPLVLSACIPPAIARP